MGSERKGGMDKLGLVLLSDLVTRQNGAFHNMICLWRGGCGVLQTKRAVGGRQEAVIVEVGFRA